MRLPIADCRLQIGATALALAALGAGVRAGGGEVIDRVLAVAAGQLIMLSDVAAARALGLVAVDGAADPTGAVLSALIDRQLVLVEVDRYAPPNPSEEVVDRQVQGVRTRVASPQAFEAALARSGIDERHLRETLRQDLRIEAYEAQRFTVPPPTDDEIGRYYREHPQPFTRAGQLVPFETARPDIVRALTDGRRTALIADWMAGLRRRADVVILYRP